MKNKPNGLEGRCFVIWHVTCGVSVPNQQGHVVADLGDGHYLCQFFDAIMGEPSTMSVFHISAMLDGDRKQGTFTFFENDAHLREWSETWGKNLWRQLDEAKKKAEAA